MMEVEDDDNPFALKPWDPPEGVQYRWFRAYDGSPEDRLRVERLINSGWSPVNAQRHDGRWTPPGYVGPVQIYGMVLMEKPDRVH